MPLTSSSVVRQLRVLLFKFSPVERQLRSHLPFPSSPVVRQLRDYYSLHSNCLDSVGQSGCLEIRPRNNPMKFPHSSCVGACGTGGLWGSVSLPLRPTVVRMCSCPTDNKSLHPISPVVPAFACGTQVEANAGPPVETGELNRYLYCQWPHRTKGRPLHQESWRASVAGPSRATSKIMTSDGQPTLMPFFMVGSMPLDKLRKDCRVNTKGASSKLITEGSPFGFGRATGLAGNPPACGARKAILA